MLLDELDPTEVSNFQVVARRYDVTPSGATTSIDYAVTAIKIQTIESLDTEVKESVLVFYY